MKKIKTIEVLYNLKIKTKVVKDGYGQNNPDLDYENASYLNDWIADLTISTSFTFFGCILVI